MTHLGTLSVCSWMDTGKSSCPDDYEAGVYTIPSCYHHLQFPSNRLECDFKSLGHFPQSSRSFNFINYTTNLPLITHVILLLNARKMHQGASRFSFFSNPGPLNHSPLYHSAGYRARRGYTLHAFYRAMYFNLV